MKLLEAKGSLLTNLLSCLFGIALTLGAFVLFGNSDRDTWIASGTNIVIAIAAVVAVLIHNNALKHQKNERIWGIKKEILLKLSQSLSEVMRITDLLPEISTAMM